MADIEITDLLTKMHQAGASDLYLAPGIPPRMNVDGTLNDVQTETLSPEDVERLVRQMLTQEQWATLLKERELNLAYSLRGIARFRVNVYFQRGTLASVIRQIKMSIPNFEELNLPPLLGELSLTPRGLILVTGATGCGKSTTLAAMINYRAERVDGHIVTVEDPIEYIFKHKKSIITQREVGIDTLSFKEALKNTLRQAPNVIFIGELRDAETVEFALHSAETGHLVLATLHSTNAGQTIERIINFFPLDSHHQVLMQLSYNLKAIICQRLVPKKGGGRLPALEILINTALVQELIQKGELGKLKKVMEAGRQEGMQTFDSHLKELVESGLVEEDVAFRFADSPSDLSLRLRGFESSIS
ncbi:PilT/PilU family type 4a pilus ATPase [Candidatus Sumerlaeota bacterium]|nr:PilT/PilU family type 4a pilus ATPase [Candidatus Sumerlaeota bacterium]